ncbi:MAG: hypothetical protein KBS80_07025 [Bacteroidales bacterium]|nr:hypothetical protein [Candidatus Cryptobacteroides choladohippi]
MQLTRLESKIAKFFDKMADVDLIIIDDFGMKILDGQQLLDRMAKTSHRFELKGKSLRK